MFGAGTGFKYYSDVAAEGEIIIGDGADSTCNALVILWVRGYRREQIENSYNGKNTVEGFPHEAHLRFVA